jgi:two-component system, cell cycle response regulator DivK
MNVLIIEDNEQNLYLKRVLLEAGGHTIESAPNGETGIALAYAGTFDVILLDIQLPDMDGHDVARRLLSSPDWKPVPIIAVTSFALSGDKEKALASGCSGYLEKPIDPDRFVAQIENIVRMEG